MREKKDYNHRALMISAGVHLALLILFFFIMAWRAPNPPKPTYGIELNFGLEQMGSGDVQPTSQPSPTPEEQPEENQSQPVEDNPETQEQVTESSAQESVTQPDEGLVNEKPTETKPKEVTKPAEKPKETSSKPKTDSRALYGGNQSQGDQQNASGDQGSREGSVDAQALYGAQGGGGGASLSMAGWSWDQVPRPPDTSSETGRIVFQIKIDDQGYVVNVQTKESTVSPSVERIYNDAVRKITFSKTDNASVPPFSTGTITFVLRAR